MKTGEKKHINLSVILFKQYTKKGFMSYLGMT